MTAAVVNLPDDKQRHTNHSPLWKNPTLILLALTGAVDAADARVLPALFRALEQHFRLGPQSLSSLMLAQSLSMAAASPVWGFFADRRKYKRSSLLSVGCMTWGIATILMGYSSSFMLLFLFRSMAGVALACILPLSQSIVADITENSQRGSVFGVLMGVSNVGALLGSLFATSLGRQEIKLLGYVILGWRFVLLVVGILSTVLGIMIPSIMRDPAQQPARHDDEGKRRPCGLSLIRQLCRVRTFQLIVLQGLFGAIPWNVLSFSTLWLQKSGYKDAMASFIVSWHTIGACCGTMLGGKLGDLAAIRSPSKGRVRVAQTSKVGSIAMSYIIFTILPANNKLRGSSFLLSLSFFLLGLVSSWTSAGVNRPILSEVVPSSQRASVMAWSIALEGCSAALLGAPVVGMLAERVFGYNQNDGSNDAQALSSAMQCMILIPWIFCFICYGFVGLYYERDRQEAKMREVQGD